MRSKQAAFLIAVILVLDLLIAPTRASAQGPGGDPTPTPTVRSPILDMMDSQFIEDFRIVNAFECGGSAESCMWNESDAMVLARIAIGEAPSSPNDQIYVMWNLRLRAELGYKGAGYFSGTRDQYARWGPPTSIKEEALCSGGCQYAPARAAQWIYFPCQLSDGHPMRRMLCPLDRDLPQVYWTYQAAAEILARPMTEFPKDLMGYDGFRSPEILWNGRIFYSGGLPSRQFFRGGNVWTDESPDDNAFWELLDQKRTTSTGYLRSIPPEMAEPQTTGTPVPRVGRGPMQPTSASNTVNQLVEGTAMDVMGFELPPVFISLLTVAVGFLVAQGMKGVLELFGLDLSGYAAAFTAALVGALVVFINGFVGVFPPDTQEAIATILGALGTVLSMFGVHKVYSGLKPL